MSTHELALEMDSHYCKLIYERNWWRTRCEALEKALEGETCFKCEGDGQLWADGKAHTPGSKIQTVNCYGCGGCGLVFNANAALAAHRKAVEAFGKETK